MEGSMFKDNTLEEFMSAVDIRNQQLKDRSIVVQDLFKQQAETGAALEKNLAEQGEQSQIVLRAKETAALETQTRVLDQAAKMGVLPGVNSEVLDAVSDEWKKAKFASIEKQQKLAKDLDVKFFDHPVDYVVAQIKMEDTITEAERAAARSGQASKEFADIQSVTQHLPGQMAALAATRSAATLDATLKGNQLLTDEAVNKQKIANAGINLQGIQMLDNMNAQQVNNLSTALSVQQAAKSFEMQKAQFAQSQKMFQFQVEDRMEKLEQKKLDRQELDNMADIVRKGASVAGFGEIAAFPTAKIIQMLNMKDAKTLDFLRSGMATEATGHPIISDDAGQTARVIAQHSAPLRPEQKNMKDFFTDVWVTATSPEGGMKGKYDNTKLDQVTVGARGIAVAKATNQMQNIKAGDNSNIYSPPPLPAVFESAPIKNSVWGQKVLAPQMVGGQLKEFNPDQLASLTATSIRKGEISFKEAAEGLQAAFGTARLINNTTRNYVGMGLPPQSGYNTILNTGTGAKKYNMETAQDVNTVLSKLMVMMDKNSNPMRTPGYHD